VLALTRSTLLPTWARLSSERTLSRAALHATALLEIEVVVRYLLSAIPLPRFVRVGDIAFAGVIVIDLVLRRAHLCHGRCWLRARCRSLHLHQSTAQAITQGAQGLTHA
jgi:hypothetical protein